mmetsp:Transcript_4300/g.6042  ORF Transcript_4300/g.6042 Transcript_4300/m.6042 type:complete len:128 (+) Transcript_4300:543-926(+)
MVGTLVGGLDGDKVGEGLPFHLTSELQCGSLILPPCGSGMSNSVGHMLFLSQFPEQHANSLQELKLKEQKWLSSKSHRRLEHCRIHCGDGCWYDSTYLDKYRESHAGKSACDPHGKEKTFYVNVLPQ